MKKFSLFILSLLFCTGYMSGADWNVYVARYKQDKACAISYTFDDGLAEHYTLVAPQLEKRGFRGTFWICGSNINKDNRNITDTTRMTWPQLKEMSDKGHEISNHGWAHKNFARFPIEEIKEDILKNDSAIFANTGGTFREVASYIREREETKLDVVNKKNTLLITPELKLDQKLFVEPLTMVITGKDIKKVTVKQGKRKLPVQVTGDKVLFDFDPYGDVIKVTLKSRK